MPTPPTPIDDLGTPPSTTDPTNFDSRADDFLGSLPTMATQMNELAENVYDNAVEAVEAAASAFTATSTTSNAIASSGSKTFSIAQSARSWTEGTYLKFTRTSDATKWMAGSVTAYSHPSVTVTMDAANGSGTFTDWSITVATQFGSGGALGTPGSGTLTNCTGLPPDGISSTTGTGAVMRASAPTSTGQMTVETLVTTGDQIAIGNGSGTNSKTLRFANASNEFLWRFITNSGTQRIAMINGGGTESASFDAEGIKTISRLGFPATQVASAGANDLDDYEEGTCNSWSLGGTETWTDRQGAYIKVGKMVLLWGSFTINAIGTGSTHTFSGLPFQAAGGVWGGMASYFSGFSANSLVHNLFLSGTNVRNSGNTSAATTMTVDNTRYQSGTRLDFFLVYAATA